LKSVKKKKSFTRKYKNILLTRKYKNISFTRKYQNISLTRKYENISRGKYENILLEGKYQNGGRNNTKTIRGFPVFSGVSRCPFRAILLENCHFSL
jgi:hypothetical protein